MNLPDFQTFNPNYQYTATPAQVAALTDDSGWTAAELTYTVSATGLSSGATSTPVGTTTPNVSGHNVTLEASGGVGKLAAPVIVSAGTICRTAHSPKAQKAALALATAPGDVLLQGTDAMGNTVTFELGKQPAGVTLTGLILTQTAPLFVAATGTFNATAGSNVYLQSTGSAGQDLSHRPGDNNGRRDQHHGATEHPERGNFEQADRDARQLDPSGRNRRPGGRPRVLRWLFSMADSSSRQARGRTFFSSRLMGI